MQVANELNFYLVKYSSLPANELYFTKYKWSSLATCINRWLKPKCVTRVKAISTFPCMQVLDHITDGEQYELEFVGRFTDMLYLLGSSLMVVCIRCWLQNQDIMNLAETKDKKLLVFDKKINFENSFPQVKEKYYH